MSKETISKNVSVEPVSHSGHRDRIRKKLIENGADSLETHELLEILLFYCIPRRNTNDIAHMMIDRLGSLEKVLTADIKQLTQFDYVSENGAVLIKLVNELSRRCAMESTGTVYRYDTLDKVGRFLVSLYYGQMVEKLYLLLFDSSMRMIDCVHICDGSVGSVKLCSRKIIERVVESKAANVILAHNHPGGLAVPSKEDISMTHGIETLLECLDTRLLAHIIVAGERYSPISRTYNSSFDLSI